jgi:4-diphosphocytidyl-2-C-methyl-D-erythritol kinase
LIVNAPAKLNLCLYLGETRDDGLHEIRSLFESISLNDEIEVFDAAEDKVICPDIEGENLATRALAELRERGWRGAPQHITIHKRIPVAAGLGGGSADAAAVLRLAGRIDGVEDAARSLGADVLSQLRPGFSLVGGSGERVEMLPRPKRHAFVLMTQEPGLSTGNVYDQADRMGLGRGTAELDEKERQLREFAEAGKSPLDYVHLLTNDLEPAAKSLRPEIGASIDALKEAGAAHALMTGSGPTTFGLFPDLGAAAAAAAELGRQAIVAEPLTP